MWREGEQGSETVNNEPMSCVIPRKLTMYPKISSPLFQNNDPLTLGYHGYPSHSQVRT